MRHRIPKVSELKRSRCYERVDVINRSMSTITLE